MEIPRGRDGRDGRDGLPGPREIVGPSGPKGDTGVAGPKGENAGRVVYVRWGHNSCPNSGAQLYIFLLGLATYYRSFNTLRFLTSHDIISGIRTHVYTG